MASRSQLFGDGVARSSGDKARRYNLLAARLIAELVKNSLGPRGRDKMFVDLLGEVTVTKDGATLLRKIDVEHPAAKVIIEASNAVDNEVGDGTTSVVVLAGALVQKAEAMLDMGIAPATIAEGYSKGLEISLETLSEISEKCVNSDKTTMRWLVRTCLQSKALSYAGEKAEEAIVDAVCNIANFPAGSIDLDDIKIEEKQGSISDIQLVSGIVIDKTIDSSSMPKVVEGARILLIDEDLEGKRTRTDAEIRINSPDQIRAFSEGQKDMVRSKLKHIVDSGANVVISRKGIDTFSQNYLREAGIISLRRVKENDLIWLSKATGATIAGRLDHEHSHDHGHEHGNGHAYKHEHDHHSDHHNNHHHHDDDHGNNLHNDSQQQHHQYYSYHHADIDIKLGYAERVIEKLVGDDKMVFVEGCKNPKSVTILLRANSKRTLDECHRSALDALSVLRNYIESPAVVSGGGSIEAAIAKKVREKALSIQGREQIVVGMFADALEEIPLTIARNAGMDELDTMTLLRSRHSGTSGKTTTTSSVISNSNRYGVDAIGRRIGEMSPEVVEPAVVKEQVLKTAVEVTNLLLRVDDVLMAKPAVHMHTHDDGTQHTHAGGNKQHDHFDRLGKKQRPMHHYY
ncbi:MAG TPA: TCP-1/cpn60 chaperonin family protein [Nitrososphaera sp.]|nr:TCP-1/cpn60 chaperonin family protein [Nitrososphaera sp.]